MTEFEHVHTVAKTSDANENQIKRNFTCKTSLGDVTLQCTVIL